MSRTVRRQKGERSWAKITPRHVDHIDGVRLEKRLINWAEIREYQTNNWWKPNKKEPAPIYKVVWTWAKFYPVTLSHEPKSETLKNRLVNECDWSRGSAKSTYKELVNSSNRAKEKTELYKIKESCYNGFDDVYEYDDSYENSQQRSLIWQVF